MAKKNKRTKPKTKEDQPDIDSSTSEKSVTESGITESQPATPENSIDLVDIRNPQPANPNSHIKTQNQSATLFAEATVSGEALAATAQIYSELPPLEEKPETILEFINFRFSGEWYAFELGILEEVVRVGQIASIPRFTETILGLFNYRSDPVLLVDIRYIFGLAPEELTEKSRILLIQTKEDSTGVLVDEVTDVIRIPKSEFQPFISTIRGVNAELIKGIAKHKKKHFIWLDAEKIMEEVRKKLSVVNESEGQTVIQASATDSRVSNL